MKRTPWNEAFPNPPRRFHETVTRTLSDLPEEKEIVMKQRSQRLRKSVVFAVIACVVLTTGALAVGRVSSWVGHSSSIPVYTSFPTAQEVEKDLGFVPQMTETFQNGYTFQEACLGEASALDEDGHAIGQVKDLGMDYKKGDEVVTVYLEDKVLDDLGQGNEPAETYQGIPLYYSAYINKTVPEDYVMTDQDKLDEAAGKCSFSCDGSDERKETAVQGLSWAQDGHRYSILAMDSSLTQADLVQMAHEILDIK